MILYFERGNGTYFRLCKVPTAQSAMQYIRDFLAEHNYKSYYTRTWTRDGITYFDVGSHAEFFNLVPEDKNGKFEQGKSITDYRWSESHGKE